MKDSINCKCVCHQLPNKGCSYCPCQYGCINPKTETIIGDEIYYLTSKGLIIQVPQEEYKELLQAKRKNKILLMTLKKSKQENKRLMISLEEAWSAKPIDPARLK